MYNKRYNYISLIVFPFLVVNILLASTPLDKSQWKKTNPMGIIPKNLQDKGEWHYDAETNSGWLGIRAEDTNSVPELSPEQEAEIIRGLKENIDYLKEQGIIPKTPSRVPTDFTWPLAPTENFNANDYWGISGFVDHDPTTGWTDYFCSGRTYNGHQGTDYFLWPHSWNMMDNEEVAIVAAAPGIIIDKVDGFYDRQCAWLGQSWNAVYIMHDDGSQAWYGHMKSGSLTPKDIGNTVERGEYLGLVGSSGNSTGPHLHFQVMDVNNVVVDPYEGACNDIEESYWEDQHAYRETELLRAGNYGFLSWWMECPEPSILNYRDHYANPDLGYSVGHFRDVIAGQPIYYQVLGVGGTVLYSITIIPDGNYSGYWWWWGGLLSGDDPPGIYTFRVILNGVNYDYPYNWAMDGCTDPNADNFDPLALIDNGTCTPCNNGSTIEILLSFDNYPEETFWTLNDADNVNNFMSGGGQWTNSDQYCAPPGTYQLTVYDTYGDGMCCDFGMGDFTILIDDVIVGHGGDFLFEDVTTIVIGGDIESLAVDYAQGWNMVGLPLEMEDAHYQTLFPNAYNNAMYSFGEGYSPVEYLIQGQGYLIRLSDGGTVEFTGTTIDELTISLTEGWNLISGISTSLPADVLYNSGLVVSNGIYAFDGSYYQASAIDPGMGYWVRALADGDVTLSSSSSMGRTVPIVNHFADANTLELSNGTHTSTLYFGKDVPEGEELSYSLPPVFPQMAFDARFTDDMKYARNTGEISVINTNSSLSVHYTVNMMAEKGKEWVLTTENGEEHIIQGTGTITFTGDINGMTLSQKVGVIPDVYTLHQNYPNPFNPVTTLRYDLPDGNHVTLTIYDLNGKEINQLVNTNQLAGHKSVQWNATDMHGKPVSAGVYLYQIQAGEFVQTRKMVLLK